MKVVSVVGARPQFIKAATVSRVLRDRARSNPGATEVLVHTGQHADLNMSQVFFDELDIPKPDYHLGIHGESHGAMTGKMLIEIEKVIIAEMPDLVLVYGDTNSTLAGALSAVKLQIPIAHVESGLRSRNKSMPEEINRVLTDHVSTLLYCPTENAVENLNQESITRGVRNVGDVMYDAILYYRDRVSTERLPEDIAAASGKYALATIHRAENTDNPARLGEILRALESIARDVKVVVPMHPRTMKKIREYRMTGLLDTLTVLEPQSYLSMIALVTKCGAVLTDSGGLQKEAFFSGVPCLTLREETEWVELVESGWNVVCGWRTEHIVSAWASRTDIPSRDVSPYGRGDAAERIVDSMLAFLR